MEYTTITLSGDLQWKEEFKKAIYELTLRGYIVENMPFFLEEKWELLSTEQKAMLKKMQEIRIRRNDALFVINKERITSKVREEIELASSLGKPIYYMYGKCRADCPRLDKDKCKLKEAIGEYQICIVAGMDEISSCNY